MNRKPDLFLWAYAILVAATLMFVMGCSFQSRAIMDPGHTYGVEFSGCTSLPDKLDSLKEGLGQRKACLSGNAGVGLYPDVEVVN